MAVRVATVAGLARFHHDGLDVGASWVTLELAKLPRPARDAFVTYVGVHLQVHPDDQAELARAGLEYFTNGEGRRRLRPIAAKSNAKT